MPHGAALLRNHRFQVEVDGLDQLHFTEVTGLGAEVEPIEFRSGADVDTGGRLVPGRVRHLPVTFTRGVATDLQAWEWFATIRRGAADPRNVVVTLLDEELGPSVRFRLRDAWPTRLVLGRLDGRGNDVAVESMTLVHEGLDLEAS